MAGVSRFRIQLWLCAALLLALGGPALAQPAGDEATKLAAAKKEGKVVWYVSMFDVDTAVAGRSRS